MRGLILSLRSEWEEKFKKETAAFRKKLELWRRNQLSLPTGTHSGLATKKRERKHGGQGLKAEGKGENLLSTTRCNRGDVKMKK